MENEPTKIIINDIPGLGAFLEHNEIRLDFTREKNGRVLGEVPASEKVYRLMAKFQSNPTVCLLDFLANQRRLRGRMLDVRDGEGRWGRRKSLQLVSGERTEPISMKTKEPDISSSAMEGIEGTGGF